MPTVNLMPQLDNKAHKMILSVIRNSSGQKENVAEFFRYANKNDVQGPALISYFTKYNSLRDSFGEINNNNMHRYSHIENFIDDIVNSRPDIKAEAEKFVNILNQKYPKHLKARISAANQGAVKSDTIVPKSIGKKFMVRMNLFLDKLVEFCKPVE